MLTIQNGQFSMDGKPFAIYSGAMHYFRIPRAHWEDRLQKLKAAGFNTVETYVCWNLHEPRPGEFDFSGMLDIAEYLRIAQKVGLYAIVRPGPYICAEWDFGGFPAWLLKDKNMRLRCNYEPYLACVRRYYNALGEQINGLLEKNGGNIIAMQVENEYGSYGNDKQYLQAIRKIMGEAGMDSFLFTSDSDCNWMLSGGGLPDVFKAMNFGSRTKTLLKKLDNYQTDMPYMCGEFWDGWFDHWGGIHHTRPSIQVEKEIKDFLDMDASFNMYMFHGGTNFGFTAGANCTNGHYTPTVTSYDYSAPLTEWGAYTPTYHAVRKLLLEKQSLEAGVLPPEPKLQYIGTVELTQSAGLFDNLENIGTTQYSPTPESMEQFDQNFGYILYSTTIKGKYESLTLSVEGVHDNAYLFVDGKLKKTYYRNQNPKMKDGDGFTYNLGSIKGEKKIEILVDAMGRVNYGKYLYDRKGIARVMLGNQVVFDWQITTLPLDNIDKVQYGTAGTQFPRFYKGTFKAATDADCFVDMTGFQKGCVFVNGFNLGRYWAAGPQVTLYLPQDVLKAENEIVIFEQEGTDRQSVEITDKPNLAKPKKRSLCFWKK